MATTTRTGNQIFTWLKPAGSGVYKQLVCETDSEISREAALIEAETKCDTLRNVGSLTFEKTSGFVANFTPESDQLSFATLHGWYKNKTKLDMLLADDETSPIIYSETGEVFISSFNTNFSTNEFVQGDLTLSGTGSTTLTIPV